jgi:uncharacterized phage protein (TIGR01671 family)
MNRELKFRIWCKGTSTNANFNKPRWIQPTDFILLKYYRCFQDVIESDDFVVQQYTGLKDKNGKEIYEGDIVTYQQPYRSSRLTHPATTDSYRTIKAPVIYNQDDFTHEIDGYALGTSMIKTRKDIEVIGNIFENPELIKSNE